MKLITVLLGAVLLSGCDLYEGIKVEAKNAVSPISGDVARANAVKACIKAKEQRNEYPLDTDTVFVEVDGILSYKVTDYLYRVLNKKCHVNVFGDVTIVQQ